MSSKPFRSAVKCIPISKTATTVFRLEVQVVGAGHAPASTQNYELEHFRNGQKWTMKVTHHEDSDYKVVVQAPEPVKTFTLKTYQRTCASEIQYPTKGSWLQIDDEVNEVVIGVEVTVPTEQLASTPRSPWNFTSSEQMKNWDVVLCVGETKFYAHKHALSLASSTFRSMFEGDFREKNQPEVPVNVEGTNAENFEAFLQCIYPFGNEPKGEFIAQLITLADFYDVKPLLEKCIDMLKFLPAVSNVEKLRVADEVIASFTKDDLRELIASDLKDLGEERYQKILSTCAFF